MNKIIVVDSDDSARIPLKKRLEAEGYQVEDCSAGNTALELLRSGGDAIIVGQALSDMKAVDMLNHLKGKHEAVPTIVVSRSSEEAITALRAGAHYSARTPVSVEEVALLAGRALEAPRSARVPKHHGPRVDAQVDEMLVGETPAMRAIKETIRRLCASPTTTVLVTGESGSGKDAVARAIHAATTAPDAPFVYLTPSALRESLLEVELFGIEASASNDGQARAGLLECAGGGTLFLDEISDMPQPLQGRLLRFLQEKSFRRIGAGADRTSDARVIASTSCDIESAAQNGVLRQDLVYRLSVVVIDVPPLRQRRADIPLLVRHFLGSLSKRVGRPLRDATPAAMRLLSEHPWPGNVRELCNVLERAALLGRSDVIDVGDLSIPQAKTSGVDYRLPAGGVDFRKLEREVVEQALRLARGNQTRAATLLGMTRDQIRYRMVKFNMSTRDHNASDAAPDTTERATSWEAKGPRATDPAYGVDLRRGSEGHAADS
jgi:DNA-binding NtrC family response regulator